MKKKLNQKTVFITVLTALIVAGFAIPLFLGSGLGKYSGVKRAAAIAASEHAMQYSSGMDGINHLGTLAFRIESVEIDNPSYASADTLCNNVFTSGEDSDAPDRYAVTWSYRTLFDISTGVSFAHVCRFNY